MFLTFCTSCDVDFLPDAGLHEVIPVGSSGRLPNLVCCFVLLSTFVTGIESMLISARLTLSFILSLDALELDGAAQRCS